MQDAKHRAEKLRYSEDIRRAVAESLANVVPERTTIQDNDTNTSPPPSPPSWPAPASSSEPAPPPHEPYDEDDITDAKGVTMHKNGWQYKVTVKCKNCTAQYRTRSGTDSDPYKELAKAGWDKGRDRCGNYSWQQAHCPNFRQSCYTMQT